MGQRLGPDLAEQLPGPLDFQNARFAVQLGRKIKSHSLRAFGMMALNDDQKFALKIVDWIQRDGVTEFTGRECSIHCNSAGPVKELEGAFDLLITHGWIQLGQKKQPNGGGRPSHPFEVNPAVARLNDNTDETHKPLNGNGVPSLDSAFPAARLQTPDPADDPVDEYDFHFPSDHIPF